MKLCSVEGCKRKHYANGYCERHHTQFRRHRKITSTNTRSKYDPNEIIVEGNICRMKLYNQKCEEIAETVFDLKYKEDIEKFKWHLHREGYTTSDYQDIKGDHKQMSLHAAIMYLSGQEVSDGYEIDHKDHNKLNNLDNNIRICTKLQNHYNRPKQRNNTSGLKGVSWHEYIGKWEAYISSNKKRIHLGYFENKVEAAKAYNDAAINLHGEFAQLNNIQ